MTMIANPILILAQFSIINKRIRWLHDSRQLSPSSSSDANYSIIARSNRTFELFICGISLTSGHSSMSSFQNTILAQWLHDSRQLSPSSSSDANYSIIARSNRTFELFICGISLTSGHSSMSSFQNTSSLKWTGPFRGSIKSLKVSSHIISLIISFQLCKSHTENHVA